MTPRPLVLLHTSPVHVNTFGPLFAQLAPGLSVRHVVSEALLREARAHGLERVRAQVQGEVTQLGSLGDVVMCTCSTIGGLAESAGALRVDRAMAERAVSAGRRITILAALESTLQPTRELVMDEAVRAGVTRDVRTVLCAGAWPHFEAGDVAAYHRAIQPFVVAQAREADVIVLAQASMAGVAALCPEVDAPILSSPRLGVEAAIARCNEVA